MKKLNDFKIILSYIKEYKFKIFFACLLILIVSIAEIFEGTLTGKMFEEMTKLNINKSIMLLIIYFIMCIVCFVIFARLAHYILNKVETALSRKLSFYTYKKMLNLPSKAFEKHSSGEIINRITSDVESISFSFEQLLNTFTSLITSLIILIYIFFNSFIIGIIILIFILILLFIIKIYTPKIKNIHKERKKEFDNATSIVTESVRGIREIKTLGIKNNLINDYKELMKVWYGKSIKELSYKVKFRVLNLSIKILMQFSVFLAAFILFFNNQIPLSFLIAMTYYIGRFMWLIENVNYLTETFQTVTVALDRVNEILNNKLYEDVHFGNKSLKNIKGVIEFKDVSFGYPDEDYTLKNFNLKLEPNKKIAIVGKSGQGKSTLFNLLTRIFDCSEGNIYIDDIDIKDIKEKDLRKNISIIRQEPFIFNRTIKDNFLIVDKNMKIDDIRKYAKEAYIDDYIMSLPNGYDTMLGEGGINLSGGQKQRLSIARSLSKKSKIILFDEATSALDNESQEYIKKVIDNLVKDHTIIIVAHRLSTIVDADIIYLVDKGKVAASGTHNELLENNNIYKKLYEKENKR